MASVRVLGIDDLELIGNIDRSEHVEVEYTVSNGELAKRPVSMTDIPRWDATGSGFFSVAAEIDFCRPLIERGATLLGAFDGDAVLGMSVVEASFEPGLAWLAFLHVSREHRRRGVGTDLWQAAASVATAAGASSLYVSAVPTGSAVGFYRAQGCVLADPVQPALYEREPDDIHLVCAL